MPEFLVGGQVLSFSEALENYAELRQRATVRATKSLKAFEARYKATFNNPTAITQKLKTFAWEELSWTLDRSVADLIEYGVYDVDEELLAERYIASHMKWSEDIEPFVSAHNRIVVAALESAPEPGSAPAIIGGGFGAEGAAQGIVIAAGANAVLAGLAKLAQGVAEGALQRQTNQLLFNLLQSEGTRELLGTAIHRLVFELHRSVCDVLLERGALPLEIVSAARERSSAAIVQNAQKKRFSEQVEQEALLKAMRASPFNIEAYELWRERGHPTGDGLEAMHSAFGAKEDLERSRGSGSGSGSEAAVQPDDARLEAGLLGILNTYQSDDYFVKPHIPDRKIKGAVEKYFHPALTGFVTNDATTADILALVDATSFGSAEYGLAISIYGICWNDQDGREAISWEEYICEKPVVRKGIFGVYFGDKEFSLAGSKVKKDFLVGLIADVEGYMRSRS